MMNPLEKLRPAVTNWVADHPMSLPGRVAAMRFGRPAGQSTRILAPVDAQFNVLIAPANYAGQAHAWAKALERSDTRVHAVNIAVSAGPFAFASDVIIDQATYHNSAAWQRRQLDEARRFSHVLIEAFQPPFGRLLGRNLKNQMRALAPADLAFMCHGTDVRRPSAHVDRTPWSPLRASGAAIRRQEILADRNLAILDASPEVPVFVSTPDLLEDVPRAAWCPVVVDVDAWSDNRREGDSRRVVVVHAPSKPGVKGSEYIDPVLSQLDDEGLISYRRLQGVPHDEMPTVLRDADVVVDQFGLGSYGVVACEAMAASCVVVSHVTDSVRHLVERETGLPLPIVEADPSTLETTMRTLVTDAALREQHIVQGATFVRAVHDGRRSAQVLLNEWIVRG